MTESGDDIKRRQADIEEHLAKIRKTVAESEAMVQQVELRIQETDRLLASQGLTREQVLGFRFTDEQRELVNRELERHGFGRLDFADPEGFDAKTEQLRNVSDAEPAEDRPTESMVDLDERARRFQMMMNEYRVS